MESAIQNLILDETVFISLHANTPGKGMTPAILHPSMGKL